MNMGGKHGQLLSGYTKKESCLTVSIVVIQMTWTKAIGCMCGWGRGKNRREISLLQQFQIRNCYSEYTAIG